MITFLLFLRDLLLVLLAVALDFRVVQVRVFNSETEESHPAWQFA